jgi:putative endonuclease
MGSVLLSLFDTLRHHKRLQMWTATQATGRHGEDLAHRFLRKQGYIIVARNYRLSAGDAEADIIAWEAGTLVIVEVKTRASDAFGPPDRAIDEDKRHALGRVAREYSRKCREGTVVRCDVVNVILGSPPRIELFRDAVAVK